MRVRKVNVSGSESWSKTLKGTLSTPHDGNFGTPYNGMYTFATPNPFPLYRKLGGKYQPS